MLTFQASEGFSKFFECPGLNKKKQTKVMKTCFSLISLDYLLAMCVGGKDPVGQDFY